MLKTDDVSTLSVSALKKFIAAAGLSLDGCIEKKDLQQRAREAQAALVTDELGELGELGTEIATAAKTALSSSRPSSAGE